MPGRVIRQLGAWHYHHPPLPDDAPGPGRYGRLKIALVADGFTTDCLAAQCRVRPMTPANFAEVMDGWEPDLVFVESAFHGVRGSWRYELARQPLWLRVGRPTAIFRLVDHARRRGIPTVFWNKDDDAFFDTFIHVARAFDFVFTTDIDCVPRYRERLPAGVPVNTLSMPYQPRFHQFTGFDFCEPSACFTGSYYRRILNERRAFLDMMFGACRQAGVRLDVYDRNHHRLSRPFEFRYPRSAGLRVHASVPHQETAQLYKSHRVSLNVNSVTASETMYSRRLLEILACGGIAITNPSRAVERHFAEYCHVATDAAQATELLSRLCIDGPSADDLARAAAGAEYVRSEHTWAHRLEELDAIVGF